MLGYNRNNIKNETFKKKKKKDSEPPEIQKRSWDPQIISSTDFNDIKSFTSRWKHDWKRACLE